MPFHDKEYAENALTFDLINGNLNSVTNYHIDRK